MRIYNHAGPGSNQREELAHLFGRLLSFLRVMWSVQIFTSETVDNAHVKTRDLMMYILLAAFISLVLLVAATLVWAHKPCCAHNHVQNSPPTAGSYVVSFDGVTVISSPGCTFDSIVTYVLFAYLALMLGFGFVLAIRLRQVVCVLVLVFCTKLNVY